MSLQERRESWFEHVRRAQRAGVSVASYARSIEVAPRKLYYWCRVLRGAGAEGVGEPAGEGRSSFTAVRVERMNGKGPGSDRVLTLWLADGAQLQWSSLPNPQWLAAFAHELSHR